MILVFGKSGQVATELQNFNKVRALGRGEADLSDPQVCARAIRLNKPLAVINAAAYTAVDSAEADEDLANIINGASPEAMATACAELDIPFVHLSTDYVFDGKGKNPWSVTDTPNPQNVMEEASSEVKGDQCFRLYTCYTTHILGCFGAWE